MYKSAILFILLLLPFSVQGQNIDSLEFESLSKASNWELKFDDPGTNDWQSYWFLDGLRAEVINTEKGMIFNAGQVEGDDACHAVLWTKESFYGDLKIEYEYTRTDVKTKFVNILYIQASGVHPYAEDISVWRGQREIPYMRSYFRNMQALHISYAAFGQDNSDFQDDYIRVRQYPLLPGEKFASTEIPPSRHRTGLFHSGIPYVITVIKADSKLYLRVKGNNDSRLYFWDLSKNTEIDAGRVGLRHMYTRSARYQDFKIHTKK